jgi:hypothetical protein
MSLSRRRFAIGAAVALLAAGGRPRPAAAAKPTVLVHRDPT